MKELFKRFLCELMDIYDDVDPFDERLENLCKEYGGLAEINVNNKIAYGDVYTNVDFAALVESGCIFDYDGRGYYIGTDLMQTEKHVDFDADIIRSKADIYPYVFWYNK